ncbi:MAG: hypothetical protein J5I81_12495 [Nitrococcus mobilis]|nr:hypothetical protein [Nitrococcus mobilis]
MDEIQIYIGCTPAQEVVAKVLAWSVLEHTRDPVQFHRLHECAVEFEMPRQPENRPGTPFSFQRFMIPEIAGFKGRAIYMDSDQIVFKDIAKVFERPMGGAPLLCCDTHKKNKPRPMLRSSFMLLDCARLDWKMRDIVSDLDAERYSYQSLFSLEGYDTSLPRSWNSLDQYRWPITALLHYTGKENQPWIHHHHKLARLWFGYLFSALDADFISEHEVYVSAENGLVRPSIKYQLEHRLIDPRRMPDHVKAWDDEFIDACAQREFNTVPGEYRPPSKTAAARTA